MSTDQSLIPNVGWRMVSPSLLGVVQGGEYADRIIDLDGGRIEWHPNQQLSSWGIPSRPAVQNGCDEYVLTFTKRADDPWHAWLKAQSDDLRFVVGDVTFMIISLNEENGRADYAARGWKK